VKRNLESHRRILLTAALLCAAGCGPGNSEETSPWEEHTYVLTIPATAWSPPVGGDITPFVPHFAIRVERSSGDELDVLMGAVNAEGQQEPCNPTTAVKAASKSDGGFALGPVDVPVYLKHGDAEVIASIYDLKMTAVLPDGAEPAQEGTFAGTLDFREVYGLFVLLSNPTPDGVCSGVQVVQVQCGPCRDEEPYCVTLTAEEVGTTESGTSIQPIDENSAHSCLD
jgi:hypothetical protein